MGYALCHALREWQELIDSLSARASHRGGRPLSVDDNCTFSWAIGLQAAILSDGEDYYRDESSIKNKNNRIRQWAYSVHSLDVKELACFLGDMETYIRHIDDYCGNHSYHSFKRYWKKLYPFVNTFLAPIKWAIIACFTQPTADLVSLILQHVSFLNRLSLRDIDLSDECMVDYLACEERISKIEYPEDLVISLTEIITKWFKECYITDPVFKHGPGATNNVDSCLFTSNKDKVRKYSALYLDDLGRYVCRQESRLRFSPISQASTGSRECEIVFVPKSAKTFRTISMEPPTLQYMQQGVHHDMVTYMKQHWWLGKVINLTNQEQNADMARLGSIDGFYSTIDLSQASDSITWDLVKTVFKRTPLLRWLYATRSRCATYKSTKVPLCKFAPMGSALCFPIQCVIFSAIVEHVVVNQTAGRRSSEVLPYSVYGDDIVCRFDLTSSVVETLRILGFIVNKSKSFTQKNSRFRESCGGEYYEGVEVTPLRISRKFSARCPGGDPTVYANLVSSANSLFDKGFWQARTLIVRRLLRLPIHKRPLFIAYDDDQRFGIKSTSPTNYHLLSKWNSKYQRSEYKTVSLTSNTRYLAAYYDEVEKIRLFETLIPLSRRESAPRPGSPYIDYDLELCSEIGVSVGYPHTRLRTGFVPAHHLSVKHLTD